MKDKVSKYNIEVEYENGILLYNSLTNRIFPVTTNDYAVIETLMEHLSVFCEKYPNLYKSLKDNGFILDTDFDELSYIKLQNKRCVLMNRDYRLTINPTLDCNLKCWYCSVAYAGAKHQKERMSDEIIDSLNKHIDMLVKQQRAKSITLDWFGGEPTMYFDEVIRKVSDSAMQVTATNDVFLRQQITTNATLLNEERIKYMKEAHFDFFQVAIDGNERKQNSVKRYADKSGTYRDVINNLNMIADIIPDALICLRINYDRQTLKNIKEIIADFSERAKERITVDFQRIWQIACTDEMRRLMEKAREEFQNAGFKTRYWAYKPHSFKRCYADSYNCYVINYNGKVFKCTARDYGDDLVIGELKSSGVISWNEGILSKLFEKATFENEKCENCNLLPLCMGPCIQKCYEARIKNVPVRCLFEEVEMGLSTFVLGLAKQQNLI